MENITVNDNIRIEKVQSALIKKGFQTVVLNSNKEVKDFINTYVPDQCTVGLGDSITTCKLNVRNILYAKGSNIFYSWDGSENYNRSMDTFDTLIRPDYYLTRINALTTDGEILMKDYSRKIALDSNFPANVFAFAGLNRVVDKFEKKDSIKKYAVIKEKPEQCKFTVALLPFLDY
ncbi:MAG: LUD domain-containing protein [Bacteroidales bacterium]|nr:LUD domain-containing protein [Bacteroidales bacterium]